MNQSENSDFQFSYSPPEETAPLRFSLINILSGIVLAASLIWLGWAQLFYSRLDQVVWPERGLPLVVSRTMELKEALKEIPTWEKQLYRAMLLDSPNDLPLAIGWYEELAATSSDPNIPVQLAILEAEAGRIEHVHQRVAEWELREDPYPQFARLIKVAYLNPSEIARDLDIRLVQQISEVWFRERLMTRLISRTGDHKSSLTFSKLSSRSARMIVVIRLFTAMALTIIIGGSLALFVLVFHSRPNSTPLAIGTASIPPHWSGAAGTVVLIRGCAIFVLLTAGAGFLEDMAGFSVPLLWFCVSLLSILALLGLAHWYLLKPLGVEIQEAFGLSLPKAGPGQFLLWVAVLLAAAWLGDWGISWTSERLGWPTHWTESFDSDFVWGNPSTVGLSGVHAVALGPIFEELVFRGLLFATLRRKFQPGSAAALSAIAFSMIHGYSLPGFLSVAWTGVLLAWAYEKTKSLLPGIIAHGFHNLLSSLILIVFLRS